MRKVFLYNHGGSENHGCEALVRTVCELFKEEDIILYSEMPQQDLHYGIQQFADVKSAKKWQIKDDIPAIVRKRENNFWMKRGNVYEQEKEREK